MSGRAHVAFSSRGTHRCYKNEVFPSIQQGMSTPSIAEMCAWAGAEPEPAVGNKRICLYLVLISCVPKLY